MTARQHYDFTAKPGEFTPYHRLAEDFVVKVIDKKGAHDGSDD